MNTNQLPPEFFDFLKEMPAVVEAVKQIPLLVEAAKQIPMLVEAAKQIPMLVEAVKPIPGLVEDVKSIKSELEFNTIRMSQIQLDIDDMRDKVNLIHRQTAHYGEVQHVVEGLKEQVTSTFDGFTQVLLDNKSKAV